MLIQSAESCAHVFCLNCIREWRTAKCAVPDRPVLLKLNIPAHRGKSREQIDNGVLHKCPACRVSSRNIIPSHFWLGQGPEKEAFIAGYKAKMSQVPCRNFAASLDDAEGGGQPFCPFGKDCVRVPHSARANISADRYTLVSSSTSMHCQMGHCTFSSTGWPSMLHRPVESATSDA